MDSKAEIKLDYRGDIRDSGSTVMSLNAKIGYRLWKSWYESSMVKGGYRLSSGRAKNSQLKRQKSVALKFVCA